MTERDVTGWDGDMRTDRDRDPFTMEMLLCCEGHVLASSEPQGAYPNGYQCTGHAHKFGQHIRCTWPGHDVSPRKASS